MTSSRAFVPLLLLLVPNLAFGANQTASQMTQKRSGNRQERSQPTASSSVTVRQAPPSDDSDIPPAFVPNAVDVSKIPAFLGLFGPAELIRKVGFNSAPGKWIEYEFLSLSPVSSDASRNTIRFQEVLQAPRGSRWIEMLVNTQDVGEAGLRLLVNGEGDGNIERVIAKAPQMPPIEVPVESAEFIDSTFGPDDETGSAKPPVFKVSNVGKEKVKVPLGTFLCDHWVVDADGRLFDFWIADDPSIPFIRAVKFTTKDGVVAARAKGDDASGKILVPGPRR